MKKTANYSSPLCEVRNAIIRASILAGSQVVSGKDMQFENGSRVRAPQLDVPFKEL